MSSKSTRALVIVVTAPVAAAAIDKDRQKLQKKMAKDHDALLLEPSYAEAIEDRAAGAAHAVRDPSRSHRRFRNGRGGLSRPKKGAPTIGTFRPAFPFRSFRTTAP